MESIHISLNSIRTDTGTQMRVAERPGTVDEYAEALERGCEFPPVTVFQVGTEYVLADGFHRYAAYKKRGLDTILCIVRQGTLDDAREFACCANQDHGLPRTSADKRNAVERFFSIPDRDTLTNSEVARRLGVSVPFVKDVRDGLGVKASPSSHHGAGSSKRRLNELIKQDNSPGSDETGLNRLIKSPTRSGETVTVSLPADDAHGFAVALFEHFDTQFLKSCLSYLGDVLA